MNSVALVKKVSTFVLIALAAVACRKKYAYSFEDGTPGDGAAVPSITIDTTTKKVDVSKYAQARVFPGLVCSSEPRVNYRVSLDLNYNFVGEDLRISVPPQPQFSTGLYAAPGELVTIDVPAGDYALSVQIGAWTDNLTNIQNAPRDPVIYTRTQLAPGRNYVRNLYGGHVYIYAGRPLETPVDLVFGNVVKSPDFILGQTTNDEWQAAIRSSCVPYLELRSQNIIFTVPRQYCIDRPIADPTQLMKEWDDAINLDYYRWEGLEAAPVNAVDKAPLLPWRIVQDIKPSAGYGHSGYPVVTFDDYGWFDEFTNISQIRGGGCWGTLHELGHNNQQTRFWSWSSLGETSNNLFAFKVARRQQLAGQTNTWPPKHPALPTRFAQALAFALDGNASKNFDGTDTRINDPFSRLTPFVQIFDKIPADWGYVGQPDGWQFMTELYRKARRASRISLTDQDKRDFVYEALCAYTRRDWQLFFKAWGIAVSNISTAKMSAAYPLMTQEIWKYNPLTRTGGDTYFDVYNRALWSITASSEETSGEGAAPQGRAVALLDGDINTFWHSRWSTAPAAPPHVLTVNMGRPLDVKGFSFRHRYPGMQRAIKNLKVETSNDGTTWQLIPNAADPSITNYTYTLALVNTQQNFLLPQPGKFQYFRITVPTVADVYDGSNFAAMAELNIIKP